MRLKAKENNKSKKKGETRSDASWMDGGGSLLFFAPNILFIFSSTAYSKQQISAKSDDAQLQTQKPSPRQDLLNDFVFFDFLFVFFSFLTFFYYFISFNITILGKRVTHFWLYTFSHVHLIHHIRVSICDKVLPDHSKESYGSKTTLWKEKEWRVLSQRRKNRDGRNFIFIWSFSIMVLLTNKIITVKWTIIDQSRRNSFFLILIKCHLGE